MYQPSFHKVKAAGTQHEDHAGPRDAVPVRKLPIQLVTVPQHAHLTSAGHGWAGLYLLNLLGLLLGAAHCPAVCVIDRRQIGESRVCDGLTATSPVDPSFRWLPRVLLIVPGYFHLTLRMALRFWVRHGFKIMFVIVTISYVSATFAYAARDNPFAVVGVSHTATPREIRKACRKASLELCVESLHLRVRS